MRPSRISRRQQRTFAIEGHDVAPQAAVVPQYEKELMYIAQMKNPEDLNTADYKEEQEQWTVFTADGSIRVRKTNGTIFTMTIKKATTNAAVKEETEEPCSEAVFNSFKNVAVDGMNKTRYFFKTEIPDLVWEVDVFKTCEGQPYLEWVKIDLELPRSVETPPTLPFDVSRLIAPAAKLTTPEDRETAEGVIREKFVVSKECQFC